jgi:hypothetical protein
MTAPEMPRPPAVEALGAVEPSNADTGRGTGVREAYEGAQGREYPDVDGWSVRIVGGEVVVRRDSGERELTGWDIPLAAVLAFIADQEGEADER